MTSTVPNPNFKVTAFLKSTISQTVCLKDKVAVERTVIGNRRWWIDRCRFHWPWVTLKGRMRGINFFRRILITLVRSATWLHLHKCVAWFVGDSWVSCTTIVFTIMLVCWWWWFDWSFARLIAPVVTALASSLGSIKLANPGSSGKWLLKLRDSVYSYMLHVAQLRTDMV